MSVCAVVAAVPVHEEMSWLNAEALLNMYCISVTCDVSHSVMSPLNVLLPPKPLSTVPSDPFISVTKLVSQFGIVP